MAGGRDVKRDTLRIREEQKERNRIANAERDARVSCIRVAATCNIRVGITNRSHGWVKTRTNPLHRNLTGR